MSRLQSSLYLKVMDPRLEHVLTNRLLQLLSGADPNLYDVSEKVKQIRGKEGAYVLSTIRKKAPRS
jgi:hypothetical protein